MKYKEIFPSKWLGHENFEVPRVLSVKHVEIKDVSGGQGEREDKPVVYFHEHPKGLILNKTNFQTLAILLGDDTDTWKDGKCELYKDMTSYKGEMMPCVRIRAAGQQQGQAAPIEGFDAPAEEEAPPF